jgi:putative flippase GtrA
MSEPDRTGGQVSHRRRAMVPRAGVRPPVPWSGDPLAHARPVVTAPGAPPARGRRGILHEAIRFGLVGAICFVVDVGMFNFFRVGLDLGPLTSKTLSVVIATTVSYVANRQWTFAHRERSGVAREYALFFVLNGIGLGIALVCLGLSHYLFGFTSALADNIAANLVGLGLGTLFRFWSYRRWVFLAPPVPGEVPEGSASV